MKFTTAIAAAATVAAVVNADALQINNPTQGTVWKAGTSVFLGWSGNCASMGNSSKAVDIYLNQGPADAVRFVTILGQVDCSGSGTRADLNLSSTLAAGDYSIAVQTSPAKSYTNIFTILAADGSAPPAASTSGSAPPAATTNAKTAGAMSLTANTVFAVVGAVALAAAQYAL